LGLQPAYVTWFVAYHIGFIHTPEGVGFRLATGNTGQIAEIEVRIIHGGGEFHSMSFKIPEELREKIPTADEIIGADGDEIFNEADWINELEGDTKKHVHGEFLRQLIEANRREETPDQPYCLGIGAIVTIEYVPKNKSNWDIRAISETKAEVDQIEEQTLTVVPEDPSKADPVIADVEQLTVKATNGTTFGDIAHIKIVSPYWDSEFSGLIDRVTMRMIRSGYSYQNDPPYFYPEVGFFEEFDEEAPV
jgi:hypothetical protein